MDCVNKLGLVSQQDGIVCFRNFLSTAGESVCAQPFRVHKHSLSLEPHSGTPAPNTYLQMSDEGTSDKCKLVEMSQDQRPPFFKSKGS